MLPAAVVTTVVLRRYSPQPTRTLVVVPRFPRGRRDGSAAQGVLVGVVTVRAEHDALLQALSAKTTQKVDVSSLNTGVQKAHARAVAGEPHREVGRDLGHTRQARKPNTDNGVQRSRRALGSKKVDPCNVCFRSIFPERCAPFRFLERCVPLYQRNIDWKRRKTKKVTKSNKNKGNPLKD